MSETKRDHERIWLQADAGAGADRLWCQDKVWPDESDNPAEGEPTEYVRADIAGAAPELLEALREYHKAVDWLMAALIAKDDTFHPTKSRVRPTVERGFKLIERLS